MTSPGRPRKPRDAERAKQFTARYPNRARAAWALSKALDKPIDGEYLRQAEQGIKPIPADWLAAMERLESGEFTNRPGQTAGE